MLLLTNQFRNSFSKKALLYEPDWYGRQFFTGMKGTVEFAGKLLCIRRSQMLCNRFWPLIGHKNIFCTQSQTSKILLRVTSIPGAPSPILEHFAAIFPEPTNCPWVSKDEEELSQWINDAISEKKQKTTEGIYMHGLDDLSAAIFTFWVYVMSTWIIHSTKAT